MNHFPFLFVLFIPAASIRLPMAWSLAANDRSGGCCGPAGLFHRVPCARGVAMPSPLEPNDTLMMRHFSSNYLSIQISNFDKRSQLIELHWNEAIKPGMSSAGTGLLKR